MRTRDTALTRIQTVDAMEDVRPLTTEEIRERKTRRDEVAEAYLRIEMYWQQHSRQLWLSAVSSEYLIQEVEKFVGFWFGNV